MTRAFTEGKPLGEVAAPKQGLATTNNARFTRSWWEAPISSIGIGYTRDNANSSQLTWFPYNKGGEFRKWYGNQTLIVNWFADGLEIRNTIINKSPYLNGNYEWVAKNMEAYFNTSVSWSKISSGTPAFRLYPQGFVFDVAGTSVFSNIEDTRLALLSFCNSQIAERMLTVLAPTLNYEVGQISQLPIIDQQCNDSLLSTAKQLVQEFRNDWNTYETSWDFKFNPLVKRAHLGGSLADALERWWQDSLSVAHEAQELETENNRYWAEVYGLRDEVPIEVPLSRVSLTSNPYFRYVPNKGATRTDEEYRRLFTADAVRDLISYGVGCLFGRYSLDTPGLVLADQGDTIQDFLDMVPRPSFTPDKDGVIPITSGEWFADDIVTRFRSFLSSAFGKNHLETNLSLIESSLDKSLRQYFVKEFYKDHCRRYSNRPIYWMVSSRRDSKASFQALIYLHRYTPDMLNTVLGDYLREFQAKLRSEISHLERSKTAADQKRADTHRKALTELEDYERDVLFPLASQRLPLDLDDGVLVNYLRFGEVLQKIPTIEKKRRDVQTWTWPTHQLSAEDGTK